ncbi:MAG: MFS transporter [Rubrivivax sp.]
MNFDRTLLALIVSQVGLHGAMAGLRMAAPLDALREGASPWRVGVLLALFAAAPVLLALPAGRMADRWGFHRPMRLAAAVTGLGMLAALVSTLLPGAGHGLGLALGAVAAGAGANIGMIAIQRTGGLVARDAVQRVRVFSWLAIAPSVGNMIGPVLAGGLIDLGGFRTAYAALLLMPLASVSAARAVPAGAASPATAPAVGSALGLLALPGMKRLLVVNWLLSMCWDVHAFAVPILGHGHGFSATVIGLVLGSFTLSVTGVRLVIPGLAERLRPEVVIPGAMALTAGVFAVYPFASAPLAMAACAVVLGLALGCVQPMMMSVLHHLTPHDRHGQALAFRSMTINGSSTLMPLLFGAGGALLGASALFWLAGSMVGAGSALARRLRT